MTEFAHDEQGNVVKGVVMDPDRPLESELEWCDANIAQGAGGQEMKVRKQRIEEALLKQKEKE